MSADRGGIYFFYFSFSPFLGIKNSRCLVRSGTLYFNVFFLFVKTFVCFWDGRVGKFHGL